MKKRECIVTIALMFLFLCAPLSSQAGDDLVQSVVDGCKQN